MNGEIVLHMYVESGTLYAKQADNILMQIRIIIIMNIYPNR